MYWNNEQPPSDLELRICFHLWVAKPAVLLSCCVAPLEAPSKKTFSNRTTIWPKTDISIILFLWLVPPTMWKVYSFHHWFHVAYCLLPESSIAYSLCSQRFKPLSTLPIPYHLWGSTKYENMANGETKKQHIGNRQKQ